MPFEFRPQPDLPGVIVVQPRAFADPRGWFQESFRESEFARHGITGPFRQDNHSLTTSRGVLRGLHYQLNPLAQGKLVRCTAGAIYDAAVDIRRGSPTYGRWTGIELSAENRTMLWVPEGFLHGFCTLTERAEVVYKTTAEYSAEHDRAVRWDDPAIGVQWPVERPDLSPKDAAAPLLADAENNFVWSETR